MTAYSLVLIVLVACAILFIPSVRRAVFQLLSAAAGIVVYIVEWIIFDLFNFHVPAWWARVQPHIHAIATNIYWGVIVYLGAIILLIVGLGLSLYFEYWTMSTIFAGVLALIISLFFHPWNGLRLWLGLQPARSLGFILLTLVLIMVITSLTPYLFSGVIGNLIYGVVLVSWMWFIVSALKNTPSLTPHYILTTAAILIVVFVGFGAVFPEQVRAAKAAKAQSDKKWGLSSFETEKDAFVTKGIVEHDSGAIVWNIQFNDKGVPINRTATDLALPKGTRFMTKDPSATSYNAQGSYIEIILPINIVDANGKKIQTDEYPYPDANNRRFVDATKVSLFDLAKQAPDANKQAEEKVVQKPAMQRYTVTVAANKPWTNTGINVTGKSVTIRYLSGSWNSVDDQYNQNGSGLGVYPGTIMPNVNIGQLIAKTDKLHAIGTAGSIKSSKGELFLGMNDIPGKYNDNHGELTVEITVE